MRKSSKKRWSCWMKSQKIHKNIPILVGYWTQRRNSVKIKQSTMQSLNLSRFWIVKNLIKINESFLKYLVMPLVLVLILMWAMIILMTLTIDLIFITALKRKSHSIWNTLTKSQKGDCLKKV